VKLAARALGYVPLVVVTMLITDSKIAAACSCFHSPPAERLEKASFVIRGIVLEREVPPPRAWIVNGDTLAVNHSTSLDMVRYRVQVSAVWKGDVAEEETVYSRRLACGLPLSVGDECLLFLRLHEAPYPGPLPWPPEWTWAGDPEFPARTFGQCDGSSLVEYRGHKVEQAAKMLAFLGEPIRTIEVSKPDSTR
jgi:hypothetical protein